MKIIDSKGRLFGKLSVLDLAAAGVILLTIIGVFFFPGTPLTHKIVAQTKLQPVEVQILVRGLGVSNLENLDREFERENQADIVIRNQPAGKVEIVSSTLLPRTTVVPQPDGTVKALPDPRPEVEMIRDLLLTLEGRAEVTDNGIVLDGSKKIKIGSSIQLQGDIYDFNGTIVSIDSEQT